MGDAVTPAVSVGLGSGVPVVAEGIGKRKLVGVAAGKAGAPGKNANVGVGVAGLGCAAVPADPTDTATPLGRAVTARVGPTTGAPGVKGVASSDTGVTDSPSTLPASDETSGLPSALLSAG